MYDLNKIAECINDLTKINQEDLDVFKNLADEHSYSPVFSILYLKALSKFNPLVFENVLKDYAYIIPSRKKLYELIHEAKLQVAFSIKALVCFTPPMFCAAPKSVDKPPPFGFCINTTNTSNTLAKIIKIVINSAILFVYFLL